MDSEGALLKLLPQHEPCHLAYPYLRPNEGEKDWTVAICTPSQ
jgi:hypothetical protein